MNEIFINLIVAGMITGLVIDVLTIIIQLGTLIMNTIIYSNQEKETTISWNFMPQLWIAGILIFGLSTYFLL